MAKTFLRRQVNRSVGSRISFTIEHEVVVVERTANDACRRCMKPFGSEDPWPVITKTCAPMDSWLGRTAWGGSTPGATVRRRAVSPALCAAAGVSRRCRVAPCAGSLPGGPH